MNKRIVISLSVIGIVAAIAVGGTIAYFNDTETSTGNIFVAGVLDLELGDFDELLGEGSDSVSGSIVLDDMKPGEEHDEDWYYDWVMENHISIYMKENSNPAHVYLTIDVADNGGTISEPECEAEGGDWLDGECFGNTSPVDDISSMIYVYALFGGGPDYDPANPEESIIDEWDGELKELVEQTNNEPFYLGEFQPYDYYWVALIPFLSEDAGNEYQGDQSVVTFTFNAYQNEQD